MRRAEWRARPDDPTTLLGWWWRAVLEGEVSGLTAIGLLSGTVFLGIQPVLALLPAGAALTLDLLGRRYQRSSQLDVMLDDPPPAYRCLTGIEYWRNGMRIGTDVMALSFTDGWLYAEGVRSTFAVRPSDVLRLRTPVESGCTFGLADGTFIRVVNADLNLRDWLRRWQVEGGDVPGEPIFPPLRVYPQELAKRAGWVTSTSVLFLAAIVLSFNLNGSMIRTAVLFAGLGMFVIAAAWAGMRLSQLARFDDRAKKAQEVETAEGEHAPPLESAAERTIEGSRAEVRNSLVE